METQNQNQQLNNNQEPNNSWLSKHMLLGYVFLALVFAGIVAGVYYAKTSIDKAVDSPADLPMHKDPTANWKTYRNEEYGFELKIPEGFGYLDKDIAPGLIAIGEKGKAKDSHVIYTLVIWKGKSVNQVANVKNKILLQDKASFTETDRKISEITVKEFVRNDAYMCVDVNYQDVRCKSFGSLWEKDNVVYDFSGSVYRDGNYQKFFDVYNQILSTFKFTDSQSTMNTTSFLAPGMNVDCKEVVNYDPPNSKVTYENYQKGISFEVPYNTNWGNDHIKLRPFDELPDHIIFGNLEMGEGCGYYRGNLMYFDQAESADELIKEIEKREDYQYFVAKPTKINVNGLNIIKYEGSPDLCAPVDAVVIGNKLNYRFTYGCGGDINKLMDIAKTVKLISS